MEGSLAVLTYHGKVLGTSLLRDYDVVLTTYATVSSELSRGEEHSALYAQNWFRIILDEGTRFILFLFAISGSTIY